MSKEELMKQYTAEQLAEMVVKLQNASEVKNDEIYKLKWQISNLEEESGRLQAKIDTYNNYLLPKATKEAYEDIMSNHYTGIRIITQEQWLNRGKDNQSEVEKYRKSFEEIKKERDYQIAEYKKKINELEQHHKFSMMQIDDVLVGFLGVTHEIMDKPYDFEKVLQELVNKDKTELERVKNTINQIDDILEKLFGVRHGIGKPNEFEKILKEKIENYKTISDLIPAEPIKVADMLINASKKRTNCMTGEEYDKYIFDKWQLRQIAEHLLVYCNHNGEDN